MKNLITRTITLVMLSLFVISCGSGSSNVLTGIKVSQETRDGDTWMSFASDLNLGAMSFAAISVPVLHPKNQQQIGQLELTPGLAGVSQIKISVNASEVMDIDTMMATLPNGNMIPLIANNPVISVSIGNGARVYLAISQNVTAIGVAVPISAFDQIGQSLPGLNFFPIVNNGDVVATAGIFTGLKAGQNGIAVVADVSKVVNLGQALSKQSSMLAIQAEEANETLKLDMRSHSGSAVQKSKLDEILYKLHQKKTILKMKK